MNYPNVFLVFLASFSIASTAMAVKSIKVTCPKGSELTWYPEKVIKDYNIKYHATAGGFGELETTITGLTPNSLYYMFSVPKSITAGNPQKQPDGSWKWSCTYTSDTYETANLPLTIGASGRFTSCTLVTGSTSPDNPPSIECF